jgi:hypothetical protein
MRAPRPSSPLSLEVLRDSQRAQWKGRCVRCGAAPLQGGATEVELRARVRQLELRVQQLEAQLAAAAR